MTGSWTAASVRAGAIARERLGAGRCRDLAGQGSLADALTVLGPTVYGPFVRGAASLPEAAHGTRVAVLWQLRVLAGWFPPSGARLARALAAGFERDNIAALAARVSGRQTPPDFELGTLATAWPLLRRAGTVAELEAELTHTVWATAPEGLPLRDRLTLAWLRRLDAAAPTVRTWRESALVVLIARNRLLDGGTPPPALREEARRLVGPRWETAQTLDDLRRALPRASVKALEGVSSPQELWRAESALRRRVESEAFALLRRPRPGPEAALGGIAVLACDAWRVRAALSEAAADRPATELLDVVA